MSVHLLQSIAHELQLIFAAIFFYQALQVYRVSRIEVSIPYTGIVPMLLSASAYYFFWEGYWKFDSPHAYRITAHLLWLTGALMIGFHIDALESYFRPSPRWIARARQLVFLITIPALLSLLTLLFSGRMFLLSPAPMAAPPLAFPVEIRDQIQRSFSMTPLSALLALGLVGIELSCLSYYFLRLIRANGDRWLAFGLFLSLIGIINDIVASIRPPTLTFSFLFIAVFVEIARLTILIERANRERLLRVEHSMRLAQLGEMTATVAHELSNPLAIILGHAAQGLKNRDAESSFRKIQASAERMATIVQGLKNHARSDSIQNETIDLESMLREIVEMLRPIYVQDRIVCSLEISSGVPTLIADRGRLQQVLLNLLKNAQDSSEGMPERRIVIRAFHDSERTHIQIADNGCGIAPEIMDKIFNPFFTTKARDKGTGIGLSFVQSQIRSMDGEIEVRSKPGETVFDLSFFNRQK